MNTTTKESGSKKLSALLDYISVSVVILGIILFYILKINIWFKWGIVAIAVISGFSLFYFVSPTGVNLHSYFKESWNELGKVVWPTRKEALQFTWIVFLFVIVLAVFLWAVDSSIAWLFYSVILGKPA